LLVLLTPGMCNLAETTEKEEKKIPGGLKNDWSKFLWLSVAIISLSIISNSMNTFLPLYWVNVLYQSKATSGIIISCMTIIGAVISILAGRLADRFGVNNIIKAGWILLLPSIFSLTFITNPVLFILLLVPLGSGIYLINAPTILLGQKYLPKNIGFASGITLGLAASIGGLAAPILGRYADNNGLPAAIMLLSILPLLGILVSFTSKPPR